MLHRAIKAVDTLSSYHFDMVVVNGTFPLLEGVGGRGAEGDALRPDRWKARVRTDVPSPTEVALRGLEGSAYYADPRTGSWLPYSTEANPAAFFDADGGASAMFQGLTAPVRLGDAVVAGRAAYNLHGAVPADLVRFITGLVEPDAVVQLEMWLDQETDYLLRVRLTGRIAPSDSADIVRSITLSDFNAGVEIEAPGLGP